MSAILPQLVLLAAGDSIAPPLLLLDILFLGSQSPLPNATALALGYLATFTTMGVVGPIVFSEPAGAEGATSVVRRIISATIGGLLIVLDFRSLLKIPDPDARPSRWIESTSSLSPPRAFGSGMALCPSQIKNLAIFVACLKLIAAASLGLLPSRQHRGARAGALRLRHTGLALIGLYAPIQRRVSTMLGSLRAWMEKNSRAITVALCFVFGAFFLIKSLSGLQERGHSFRV